MNKLVRLSVLTGLILLLFSVLSFSDDNSSNKVCVVKISHRLPAGDILMAGEAEIDYGNYMEKNSCDSIAKLLSELYKKGFEVKSSYSIVQEDSSKLHSYYSIYILYKK